MNPKNRASSSHESLANDTHSPLSSSCLDLSPARLMGGGRGTEEGAGDRSSHMAKFILETRKKKKIQGTTTAFTLFTYGQEKPVYLASAYVWCAPPTSVHWKLSQ